MQYSIQNQTLLLEADTHGAELSRLYSSQTGLDYLWPGKEGVWGRRSPILFPNCGRAWEGYFPINGTLHSASPHGFARDLEFLPRQEAQQLIFTLSQQPSTLERYPFPFRLEVSYQLEENRVICSFMVENTGHAPMPFALGGHPGFLCPLEPERERFTDYLVRFSQPADGVELVCQGGFLTGERRPPFFAGRREVPLTAGMFDRDSVLLEGLSAPTVALLSQKSGHGVEMTRGDFPYFLLWSVPGELPFLCLEPWQGLPDPAGGCGELAKKPGNLLLPPGGVWRASYTLTLF